MLMINTIYVQDLWTKYYIHHQSNVISKMKVQIIFTNKQCKINLPLHGIKVQGETKYLGITLDSKPFWK